MSSQIPRRISLGSFLYATTQAYEAYEPYELACFPLPIMAVYVEPSVDEKDLLPLSFR